MKVLINGLQINDQNTGVQYYTKNLYEAIRNNNKNLETDLLQLPMFSSYNLLLPRLKRIFFENILLSSYFKINNCTLYHSTNYVLPYLFNFPSILTIHDLITLDYPELCQNSSVIYFKLLLSRSLRNAKKIIAVSHTVKDDILKHFNLPEDKIEVVWHGINSIFVKTLNNEILKRYKLPDKYILFVGNIEPKKNLERLIRAFYLLKHKHLIPHKLVIVGKKGWKFKDVFMAIKKLELSNEIIFTNYVPEKDLPAIYSMSDLFVFPSLYEGFGIPPLEAMACEIPVLVSNRGALPETTGGNCLLVDPYDIFDIAHGMNCLLSNEKQRNQLIEKGKKWIGQFTWENTAYNTIKVYNEIALHKNKN